MLLQKQCTRTSKAIVRREKSASNVHQGRSSLVELENPATEHSDVFLPFFPPPRFLLMTIQWKQWSRSRRCNCSWGHFSARPSWSSSKMWIVNRTDKSWMWLVVVGRKKSSDSSFKPHWLEQVSSSQFGRVLILNSFLPPAIVLQVEESWTNLSTMRASQSPLSSPDPKFPQPTPKSQIAASVARIAAKSAHNAGAQAEARRRWSTLEEVSSQERASRSHLHDGVDDGGGAQNAKEVECWRRK